MSEIIWKKEIRGQPNNQNRLLILLKSILEEYLHPGLFLMIPSKTEGKQRNFWTSHINQPNYHQRIRYAPSASSTDSPPKHPLFSAHEVETASEETRTSRKFQPGRTHAVTQLKSGCLLPETSSNWNAKFGESRRKPVCRPASEFTAKCKQRHVCRDLCATGWYGVIGIFHRDSRISSNQSSTGRAEWSGLWRTVSRTKGLPQGRFLGWGAKDKNLREKASPDLSILFFRPDRSWFFLFNSRKTIRIVAKVETLK